MASLSSYLKAQQPRHLSELVELLSIPSISTDPERAGDVRRAADWLRRRLTRAGCTRVALHRTPGHPIVYGEWLRAPGKPTILVYGHYDVQPVDPLELWDTPPFRPTVRKGRIYARGASDDKGQVIAHVNALEAYLQTGRCPINVKFLIEGEEEIGSSSLIPFLRKHKERLACDAVVVSDTAMFARGRPSICYALRGLTYLQVSVRGSRRDLHSGTFGGAVVNPANALVRMLAGLKDAKGRITVPGYYAKVRKSRRAERRAFATLPHSDERYRKSIGAPALSGEAGYTTLERTWIRPTLDINGMWAGFTGEGAKTVIPAEAHAKISMRLVPDQTSTEIGRKVTAHLKRIAPESVHVRVRRLHGGETWLTSPAHPALRAAGRAVGRAFGRAAVPACEGGSIPIVPALERILKCPCVLMGFGLHDDNLHAPNEKLDLSQFYRGIEAAAYLMEELGSAAGIQNNSR